MGHPLVQVWEPAPRVGKVSGPMEPVSERGQPPLPRMWESFHHWRTPRLCGVRDSAAAPYYRRSRPSVPGVWERFSPQEGAPVGTRCCTAVHYVYKYLSGKSGEFLPRFPSGTGTLQFNTGRGITRSRMTSRSAECKSCASVPHMRYTKQRFEQRVSHNGDKCAWSVNNVPYFYPSSYLCFPISERW